MLAPRWISFIAALTASVAIHLTYSRLVRIWHRPTINEASEVFGYYLVIIHSIVVGMGTVALVAFPLAIVSDRLFQTKKRSRYAPYFLILAVSAAITGALCLFLKGTPTLWDFPSATVYFTVASSIVWKLSYELPKKKNA